MSQNVSHWWWTKVLTLKEIKNINKFVLKNYDGIEQRQYKASFSDGSLKKNTETLIIRYGKIKKYVAPLIEECVNRNRTSFGYDIYPISDRVLCDYICMIQKAMVVLIGMLIFLRIFMKM